MGKSKKWFAFFALILAILIWQIASNRHQPRIERQFTTAKALPNPPPQSSNTLTPQAKVMRAPASRRPQDGLITMVEVLSQFSKSETGVNDLIDHLNRLEQKPVVTRDANPFSGEMHVVRTRKPLLGTRYFHAQYFTNDEGQAFVQHMSVEFKASPTAMDEAVASVQKSFGLPAPKPRTANYAQWKLSDGHILWVKKLNNEDLQDDPFNAYTSADVGTIRVAVEAEIH
jgi:hypothetical protein